MTIRGEKNQAEVLEIMCTSNGPLSAYEILGKLRKIHPKIAPPTIYRALAALTERGRVHRLESLNAFMACKRGCHQHDSILSICDNCGTVEENVDPELLGELSSVIGKSGFKPKRHVIEVHGICATCRS